MAISLTQTEARDQIATLLSTGLLAHDATVLILWDDVEGAPPAGTAVWVRITIRHQFAERRAFGAEGSVLTEHRGVATLQIFTPLGDGLGGADDWCETIRGIVQASPPPGLTLGAPQTTELGSDGTWFQTNVRVPFAYDEVRVA